MDVLSGIDEERLTEWLQTHAPAVAPPLSFSRMEGGRSNLTYLIEDAQAARWVLRRPPLHGVLPSAHDMAREHRIITALADTRVPVPRTIAYESDRSLIGSEFFLMEYVDGRIVRDLDGAEEQLTVDERVKAAESLIEVLSELHSIEPESVGLGDLSKREQYISRQLRRWHRQLELGQTRGGREVPILAEVHHRLVQTIPDQSSVSIVHGDYRIDNAILGDQGQVKAVLDWELCTLGDPLADIGLLAVYWSGANSFPLPLGPSPTQATSFPNRDYAMRLYSDRSGRDLSNLDYFMAFAYWKLAVIFEGVYLRFLSGAYGRDHDHDSTSWSSFGDKAVELADAASSRLARLGV